MSIQTKAPTNYFYVDILFILTVSCLLTVSKLGRRVLAINLTDSFRQQTSSTCPWTANAFIQDYHNFLLLNFH